MIRAVFKEEQSISVDQLIDAFERGHYKCRVIKPLTILFSGKQCIFHLNFF